MNGNAPKTWIAVDITVEPDATEAVEFAFNELGSIGTEINSLRKSKTEPVTVVGYFDEMPDAAVLRVELNDAFRIHGIAADLLKSVRFRTVENIDWLAEWKKHWKPTVVGGFIIAPPWETVAHTGKIVISIEPNMAFGTGTHETTQLCLKAIAENYRPDQTFLDVGTGTGILAIGIAKIQCKSKKAKGKILACDTDVDSVAIARENATLNGVGEDIEFYLGSISGDTPGFDFVCANLTIDVIVPILALLIGKTRATLILSGILQEQEEQIATEFRRLGIHDFTVASAGEWISVVANIPQPNSV